MILAHSLSHTQTQPKEKRKQFRRLNSDCFSPCSVHMYFFFRFLCLFSRSHSVHANVLSRFWTVNWYRWNIVAWYSFNTACVLHSDVLCIDCQCQVDCTVYYVDSGCLVSSKRFGERDKYMGRRRKKRFSHTQKSVWIAKIDAYTHDSLTHTQTNWIGANWVFQLGRPKCAQRQRHNTAISMLTIGPKYFWLTLFA